jgi:hypothetical protein
MNPTEILSEGAFLAWVWDNVTFQDRIKLLDHAPKTVWLFGAGASRHYNLNARGAPMPLAREFFAAFHQLPTSEGLQARVGPLISYLYHFKGVDISKSPDWLEDIEEFMTCIEDEIATLRLKMEAGDRLTYDDRLKAISLAEVFNNMLFIFGNVINEAQNGPLAPGYTELLKFAGVNDTFITFNWDTLLDRSLAATGCWSPNEGYGSRFTSILDGIWRTKVDQDASIDHGWRLFKLHGSTNWLVPYRGVAPATLELRSTVNDDTKVFLYWQSSLPFETFHGRWHGGYESTCYGYYPPNLPADCFPSELISAPPGHTLMTINFAPIFSPFEEPRTRGIPSSPLMLTPVRQKRYEDYPTVIEPLWQQAEKAIFEADRIIIIGYSFPATDTRSIRLLQESLQSRPAQIDVWIVDPNAESIASRLKASGLDKAKGVRIDLRAFEDLISVFWKDAPDMVRTAASNHPQFDKWVKMLWQMGKSWPPPSAGIPSA